MQEIKIKYHEDIEKLDFINGNSDWIDLRAAETIEMKKYFGLVIKTITVDDKKMKVYMDE